ncbi:hypothetical protein FDUTEX481_00659 [Tolypothrix sp. PCC 7601]|nr:hypothetical protein FDUTEX481_00659 [Tolypothrix sp. PCC 7601]
MGFVPQPNLHSLRFSTLTELYWLKASISDRSFTLFTLNATSYICDRSSLDFPIIAK